MTSQGPRYRDLLSVESSAIFGIADLPIPSWFSSYSSVFFFVFFTVFFSSTFLTHLLKSSFFLCEPNCLVVSLCPFKKSYYWSFIACKFRSFLYKFGLWYELQAFFLQFFNWLFTFDVCMVFVFLITGNLLIFMSSKLPVFCLFVFESQKSFPILWFLKNSIYIFFSLHNFISVKDDLVPKEFQAGSENTC